MSEENEPKQNTEEKQKNKMGFFKKVWSSIVKIEDYPEMAAQGFGKALSYLAKITAILAIVLCLGIIYQTHGMVQEGINYLQNEFPDFSYKEGKLKVDSKDTIENEETILGKTIIDTKTEEESKINQYINKITESGSGIIILKDKVILKNQAVVGTINYNYSELLNQMGIQEFNKQDLINYANSSKITSLYVSVFITVFVYSFFMYFLTTTSNALFLSIFGYIASWIAKIKMRYVAIFNMSVYAFTLSTILNMLYVGSNIFIDFNMEYFEVMYVSVAAIYLIAAIFILKTEFIKKQAELIKIAEAEAIVKKQLEEQREKEEKKEENKEKDKTKQEEKKEKTKEKDKTKQEGKKEETKEKDETKKRKTKKDKKEDVTNQEEGLEGSNA